MSNAADFVVTAVRVKVFGLDFPVVSGSVEYKDGYPERQAKATDDGEIYFAENNETSVGTIKFQYPPLKKYLRNAKTVERKKTGTVILYDKNGFSRTMTTGTSLNTSGKTLGADGNGELELHGTKLT